jgi:hypothetical protein
VVLAPNNHRGVRARVDHRRVRAVVQAVEPTHQPRVLAEAPVNDDKNTLSMATNAETSVQLLLA